MLLLNVLLILIIHSPLQVVTREIPCLCLAPCTFALSWYLDLQVHVTARNWGLASQFVLLVFPQWSPITSTLGLKHSLETSLAETSCGPTHMAGEEHWGVKLERGERTECKTQRWGMWTPSLPIVCTWGTNIAPAPSGTCTLGTRATSPGSMGACRERENEPRWKAQLSPSLWSVCLLVAGHVAHNIWCIGCREVKWGSCDCHSFIACLGGVPGEGGRKQYFYFLTHCSTLIRILQHPYWDSLDYTNTT